MAIVKFRRTKSSSTSKEYRAETETTAYGGTSFNTIEQLSNHFIYLNKKKDYNLSQKQFVKYGEDTVNDKTRMSHVIQDVLPDELLPYNFLHLPENEYQAKLKEISFIYANKVIRHNEYYRILNGDNTTIQEKEIMFSFSKKEMQGLNLSQAKERINSYVDHFAKKFVGSSYTERKPWLQIHAKPNGIIDCHLMLAYYDKSGKRLRSFESEIDLEEKSIIMYQMENSKDFTWLEPVITENWLQKGKLTTPEMVPEEVQLLKDILSRNPTDPEVTHRALIDAGVMVTPHREGTKSMLFNLDVKGVKFIVDKNFDYDLYKSLSTYTSFKKFGKNNKNMDVEEASNNIVSIVNRMKGKSLEELNDELLKEGVCIKLNPNKAKKINGISFDFGNGKTIKSSDLEFRKSDFTTSYATYQNLLKANEKFNQVIVEIKESGFYKERKFGSVGDKADKTTYEEWRMKQNESLYAFQKRMRNSNNSKALLALAQYEIPSPFSNIVYHNYKGRKRMIAQLVDNKTVRVYSDTPSALKAGLQIHHAKNRLSNAEIKAGYKHHIEISSSNIEALNKAWLQAKLLGYVPIVKIKGSESLEFTPTIATVEAYKKEIEKKRLSCRTENVSNIKKYLSSVQNVKTGKDDTDEADKKNKLKLSYFAALGNDVDRSAMALAYLDAYKLGVDKNVVFNPPNVHKNSRNRVTSDDLLKNYRLLLATAKAELPEEKYAAFKLELDTDTGIAEQKEIIEAKKEIVTKAKPTEDNKIKRIKPKT
ncbi:hypothetical protein [Pseudomonas extremaustralis]